MRERKEEGGLMEMDVALVFSQRARGACATSEEPILLVELKKKVTQLTARMLNARVYVGWAKLRTLWGKCRFWFP